MISKVLFNRNNANINFRKWYNIWDFAISTSPVLWRCVSNFFEGKNMRPPYSPGNIFLTYSRKWSELFVLLSALLFWEATKIVWILKVLRSRPSCLTSIPDPSFQCVKNPICRSGFVTLDFVTLDWGNQIGISDLSVGEASAREEGTHLAICPNK